MKSQKLMLPKLSAKPQARTHVLPSIKELRDELKSDVSEHSRSSSVTSTHSQEFLDMQTESTLSPKSPFSNQGFDRTAFGMDISPAANNRAVNFNSPSSLRRRAIQAKKICISPRYDRRSGPVPAFMMTPENTGNRRSLQIRTQPTEEDKRDLTLARATRADHVKAEIARIEARKNRFQKENSDIFSFVLGYFGCC